MDLESATLLAKRIENDAMPHVQCPLDSSIESLVDMSPKDIEDFAYSDLLNLYLRMEKIVETSRLFGGTEPVSTVTPLVNIKEFESRVKSATETTLKSVELHKQVDIEETKPPAGDSDLDFEIKTREKSSKERLEGEDEFSFERPEVVKKHEIEEQVQKPKAPEQVLETEKEKIEEETFEPEPKQQEIHEEQKPTLPSILQSPDEAATKKYSEMQEQMHSQLGESANVGDVKRKMLELTRSLFKEKSVAKRDKIKLQISVLKNILSGTTPTAAETKKVDYSSKMFDVLTSTQTEELSNLKDSLVTRYTHKLSEVKSDFYSLTSKASSDDLTARKAAYEKLVDSLTQIVKLLPEDISKTTTFVLEKHTSEWNKLKDSPDLEKKKSLIAKIDKNIEELKSNYHKAFSSVKEIITKQVEVIVESSSRELSERGSQSTSEPTDVLFEINNTDEGTLLYYLHSHDFETYKDYERKHISKYEALTYSKQLIAKEKGLSDELISKYFGKKREK